MMRRVFVALLAVASLLAIWSVATLAQVIDSTPCQKACYEQKSICIGACGTQGNPIECETQCADQLTDCLEQCR
jgi:hypothetical protein